MFGKTRVFLAVISNIYVKELGSLVILESIIFLMYEVSIKIRVLSRVHVYNL